MILPKIDEYVKTFKDKGWDNNKNNKLMSLRVDDDKLLEKYKTIWRQNTELETLVIYDDTYIKIEIRTYGDKVYTNFRGSNVPEDRLRM